TICLKALAKEPADRFATAGQFAEELGRWLRDESLHIRPPSLLERARRSARKHRAVARIVLPAAGLLGVVSATLGWVVWDGHTLAYKAEMKRDFEEKARAEVEAWRVLDQARQRWRQPTWGRRSETQEILHKFAQPRRRLDDPDLIDRLDLEARSI